MATLLRRVTLRCAFAAATFASSSSNPESFKQGICGSALQCREFSSKAKKKTKSSGTVPGEENMSKKDLALLQAIDHITSAFGKGAIMWLGRSQGYREVPVVSTGSFALDIVLGTGWLPKGRAIEVFGPEASGKTTLALHVIAEAQKSGEELEMRLRQLKEIEAPKEEAEDDSRKDLPEEIVSPETSSEEELAEMY